MISNPRYHVTWIAVAAVATAAMLFMRQEMPSYAPPKTVVIGDNSEQSLRRGIAARIKKVIDLQKAGNLDEATRLAKGIAKDSKKKTYEEYVAQTTLATFLLLTKDYDGAAAAFEAAIKSGHVPPGENQKTLFAATKTFYTAKNYDKTIEFGQQYLNDNSSNIEVKTLLAQSHFMKKEFSNTATIVREIVEASDASYQPVTENSLKLWLAAAYQGRDVQGMEAALTQLIKRYPSDEYTRDLEKLRARARR